jgi:hypothetical protein
MLLKRTRPKLMNIKTDLRKTREYNTDYIHLATDRFVWLMNF